MSALAIAHKKLNGDLNNSHRYDVDDNDRFLHLYCDGDYCTYDRKNIGNLFTYISTVEEFNNFKGDGMEVYTQEMADNGVLPSVGMQVELVIFENLTSCGHIEYKNEIGFLFRHKENNLCDFVEFSGDVALKPLTPPIELIDGKAYQFKFGQYISLGFYSESDSYFYDTACFDEKTAHKNSCTNIQPLTVETK